MRYRIVLLLSSWLVVFTTAILSAPVAQAANCQFVLGFATLASMIPQQVGQCLENEQHNPTNGDGLQHTTKGLLVWRKADNFTAFTDGYFTILNGPYGYEERLNAQRFAWEANPEGLSVVGYQAAGPAQLAQQPGPTLRITDFTLGEVQRPLLVRLAGNDFLPGETVTLQGTLTPNQDTSTFTGPIPNPILSPVSLGPVEAMADAGGAFTATLQDAKNPVQGGRLDIRATGKESGRTVSTNGFAGP